MINGDGNENGNKINRSNKQNKSKKKTNLQVPHTFLYISLSLFCTASMPLFSTTKMWNFLVTHYLYGVVSRVFTKDFVACVPVHFYFFWLPLIFTVHLSFVLLSRSSSFSVIHMSVDIKNNSEKTRLCCCCFFFSLKVLVAMRCPAENNSSCIWVAIPVDWVSLHWYACGADGRADVRSRVYQNFSDAQVTKFSYPWCSAARVSLALELLY